MAKDQILQTVRGQLIGATENAYDGFTDSDGNARPGGVSYALWVSEDFGKAPQLLKVSDVRVFAAAAALGPMADVEVECSVHARMRNGYPVLELVARDAAPMKSAAKAAR